MLLHNTVRHIDTYIEGTSEHQIAKKVPFFAVLLLVTIRMNYRECMGHEPSAVKLKLCGYYIYGVVVQISYGIFLLTFLLFVFFCWSGLRGRHVAQRQEKEAWFSTAIILQKERQTIEVLSAMSYKCIFNELM